MKDLGKRLVVSFVTLLVLGALLSFAYHPLGKCLLIFGVAFLAAVAVWEYKQFALAKGGKMVFPVLASVAVLEVVSFAFSYPLFPLIAFFFGFLFLFGIHFRQQEGAVVDLAVSAFGLVYIAVPLGMFLAILYKVPPFLSQDGRLWIIYLLVVTKITDIGGYFGGNLFGKRALAPSISPKKTIEGALCGLFCAMMASFVFSFTGLIHLQIIESIVLGFTLGLLGQFGDLAESLLKRDAKKKDSNALPGLGGVLDSLDSLLFNAPLLYLYLQWIQ